MPRRKIDARCAHCPSCMHQKLKKFYETHNPDKVNDVTEIVQFYAGYQNILNEQLKQKYGATLEDFILKEIKPELENTSAQNDKYDWVLLSAEEKENCDDDNKIFNADTNK